MQISIHDGRVSLPAKDATVRQILTEWARVGRTRIVNVERIAGGPITIELTNVPEQEALDLLLRSLSGYMVAPRAAAVSDASQFDRIIVHADRRRRRGPRSRRASPPPPAPFGQLNGIMPQPEDDRPNAPGLRCRPRSRRSSTTCRRPTRGARATPRTRRPGIFGAAPPPRAPAAVPRARCRRRHSRPARCRFSPARSRPRTRLAPSPRRA